MKRGRPRISPEDESVVVHVRLPAKQYDLTQQQATAARMTHAEWLRRVVARAVTQNPHK